VADLLDAAYQLYTWVVVVSWWVAGVDIPRKLVALVLPEIEDI
jgi:hypothetical protein